MKNLLLLFALWQMNIVMTSAQPAIPSIVFNPTDLPESKKTLSDMVRSIEYVPLETTNNNLIGRIARLDVSPRHILVQTAYPQYIYLFRRDGRFLAQIGKIGQGPGEYTSLGGVFLDEENQQVIAITQDLTVNKIMFDSMNGKMIKSVLTPDSVSHCIRRYGKYGLFTKKGLQSGYSNTSHALVLCNWETFNVRKSNLMPQAPVKKIAGGTRSMTGHPMTYIRNACLYTRNTSLNDTIYQLDKNGQFDPYFVIGAGKYELSAEDRAAELDKFFDIADSRVIYLSLYETEADFLISYGYKKNIYYISCNKQNKKEYLFPSKKGIPNDYDGGIDLWFMRQDEKTMYTFINASDFLNYENSLPPKGPAEAIQRVKELKRKLDEEDNPILVITTLL